MSSRSSVNRAPAWCSGGYGYDSRWGLWFFCPTLVSCWLFHLYYIHLINQVLGLYWENICPGSWQYGPSTVRSIQKRLRANIIWVQSQTSLVNKRFITQLKNIFSDRNGEDRERTGAHWPPTGVLVGKDCPNAILQTNKKYRRVSEASQIFIFLFEIHNASHESHAGSLVTAPGGSTQ